MKLTVKDYEFFQEQIMCLLEMPEIKQLDEYIQHGKITCLEHSISVAFSSFCMCKQLNMKVDYKSMIRGAMLHDYFLYDWHVKDESHRLHGFYHPFTAYHNAKKLFHLNAIEADIILKHMWPLTFLHIPRYKESVMVNIADKLCSLMETIHLPVFRPDFI
jgi:uncharacterized protein